MKMCDCPPASVCVTYESVKKGWFIFAECRNEDAENNTSQPRNCEVSSDSPHRSADEQELDMYVFLDQNLRPLTPDLSIPESKRVFEEHKHLAEEYFQVQKDIAQLYEERQKLLESETEEQHKERQSLQELLSERDSLMDLYNSLKNQLRLVQETAATPSVETDWEIVSSHSEESGS